MAKAVSDGVTKPAKRGRPKASGASAVPMREQIQNAAIELFYARSYAATTIRDIAKACRVTPGALYNHFASKEELLLSILESGIERFDREVTKALIEAGAGPEEQLRSLVQSVVRYNTAHRHEALVGLRDFKFLPAPELQRAKTLRRRMRRLFEDVLEKGQATGIFSLPVVAGRPSARHAAIAIGDMCVRVAEWFHDSGALTSEEAAQLYADLAVRMVKVPPSGPASRR